MMAEGEGFEPPVPDGTPVFKTGSLNHSDIPPQIWGIGRSGGIRTPDIQLPKLAHYQAVQRSVCCKMCSTLSKMALDGNCKQEIFVKFSEKTSSKILSSIFTSPKSVFQPSKLTETGFFVSFFNRFKVDDRDWAEMTF